MLRETFCQAFNSSSRVSNESLERVPQPEIIKKDLMDRLARAGLSSAYLLAVSFEDGIVDFGRVGTAQVVPDASEHLLPGALFVGCSLHGGLSGAVAANGGG
jgi:hypothetical protein